MPYLVEVSSYKLPDKLAVAGWFVAVPILFDGASGKLQAIWTNLLVIVHFVTDHESANDFRQVSSKALATKGDIRLCPADTKVVSLTGNGVRIEQIHSRQAVRGSEALWAFRGSATETGLSWRAHTYPFNEWGRNEAQCVGWKGEVRETNSKLSYARVDWDGDEYFRALDVAGPCGENGMGALASAMLNCCRPYVAGQPGPQPGKVGPTLTLRDGNRRNRDAVVLGGTPDGIAQVAGGARAAIWLAYGTFVGWTAEQVVSLAKASHQGRLELSRLFGRVPLSRTTSLIVPEQEFAQENDVVFEGLSLWNLGRRLNERVGPALL